MSQIGRHYKNTITSNATTATTSENLIIANFNETFTIHKTPCKVLNKYHFNNFLGRIIFISSIFAN